MDKNKPQTSLPPKEQQPMRLDDESRVKVLSPMMLVFKRFVRNRLAITGLCILVVMFVFSFLGGLFTPYSQTQVFRTYKVIPKDYASVVVNQELRYSAPEDQPLSTAARSQFLQAKKSGSPTFTAGGVDYAWNQGGDDYFRILRSEQLATALPVKNNYLYTLQPGKELPDEVKSAFEAANAAGQTSFDAGGESYVITKAGKQLSINRSETVAFASFDIFDAYAKEDAALVAGFPFRHAYEEANARGEKEFTLNGETYSLEPGADNVVVYRELAGERKELAIVSDLVVSPSSPDVFITVPFKSAVLGAMREMKGVSVDFTFADASAEETAYTITTVGSIGGAMTIRTDMETQLIDMNAPPSKAHLLGTDLNGMDMMTRLMYGGRISLIVGFIVVFIELIIGILIGGVAGYFGGWIDTMLMRLIDLFNCIPYWPVMIIIGAVMDDMKLDPTVRILLLMLILGVLGWTGIARVVRGQILSLREQDFMVAAEATGIRVSRRIFKHLVPNVMPLLIVQATMSLGSIIITEATLSFLGLGLKYPMASWGTIINAATDVYVMTNYWFIWIPAGVLILLTVLGFNFVGDGLRDAFDPKMKR